MTWFENILVIAGISFDIFSSMEIEGAMLANVKKKSLILACSLVSLLQLLFFFGGYFVCYELGAYGIIENTENIGYIVSVVVFALLGLRLIIKAIKREFVNERRREDIRVRDYIKIIAVTSFYTLVAGCAFGFVGTCVVMMALVILICSVLVVLGGLYTGHYFGFESKTGFYVVGAVVLWIASAEVLLHSVLHIL